MLIQQAAVRRRAAGARDLRRRGGHPRPARRPRSATSGARCTGRPTRSSRSPATSTHEEAVGLADGGVRDRQRRDARGSSRRPRCPPARACSPGGATPPRRSSRSRCPALPRDHPDALDARRCSTRCSATGCRAACSSACARRRGSPTTSARAWSSTPTPARSRSPRASTRRSCRRRSRRSSREVARLVDEPVPAEELAKAKAYLSGGLELRMDDTRHLASWLGGQEALHDRVYTLDEALEAVEGVPSADVQRARRPSCSATRSLRMAVVAPAAPPPRARAAPPPAAMTDDGRARRASPGPRPTSRPDARCRRSPRALHLRMGSLALARAELEAARRRAGSSTRRRCSTSPRRAGGPATSPGPGRPRTSPCERGRDAPLALVIAAEAIAAAGPAAEARRLADRARRAPPASRSTRCSRACRGARSGRTTRSTAAAAAAAAAGSGAAVPGTGGRGVEALAGGRAALAAGDVATAALRLGVAIRLEPGFAQGGARRARPGDGRAGARARRRRRAAAAGPRGRGARGVRSSRAARPPPGAGRRRPTPSGMLDEARRTA